MPSDHQQRFQDAAVLITGGLGFIGANLAHRLVGLGARVHIIDSLIPDQGGCSFNVHEIKDRVTFTAADLRDANTLERILPGQQYLFNLAGQSSHWDSMIAPGHDLEINCRAHLCLLDCIRRMNPAVRVVFASTRQIYGKPVYLPVDENHPLQPVDINGIHKIAGEGYHALYNKVHGIWCSVLRLTNTIGPRMRVKDARQTFLGLWIRKAIEGQPFEVWGGQQLRDFNHVDDVVDALLLAATSESAHARIYNLGAAPPVTLLQLADLLVELTGCEYQVRPFPADRKSIDIGDYYASHDRISSDLGWRPRSSLRQAIEDTVAYYRQHLAHYV
jgi:UDP-glucose 4-epimerase